MKRQRRDKRPKPTKIQNSSKNPLTNHRRPSILRESENADAEEQKGHKHLASKTVVPLVETAPVKRGPGRPPKAETEARRAKEQMDQTILSVFYAGVEAQVGDAISKAVIEASTDLVAYLDATRDEILALEANRVYVRSEFGEKELAGRQHERFKQLLLTVGAGQACMMVGPAGSGKTYAAEQVAEALDLPFYAISVGSQTSKSDLFGYNSATGDYIQTQFRQAYENGGVFLMDEIDAGNANVLVLLNSALAGSQCPFPDAMVPKHENFRFVATANTFGTGASRQYVGRNQLDAATLDRFVSLLWPIDEGLEAFTVSHLTYGSQWHAVVKNVREKVNGEGWRIIVSPRATLKGAHLLEVGIAFDEVVDMVLTSQATDDQKKELVKKAKEAWRV